MKKIDDKRPSNTLFSEKAKVHHLKSTILMLLLILIVLSVNELVTSGLSVFALTLSTLVVFFVIFLFWISTDTSSIIAGMVLWSCAVFLTYVCWLGDGIFDIAVLVFPCLLVLSIALSGKWMFISLFVYLISALCIFAIAQSNGLLISTLPFNSFPLWGRVSSYIVILTIFSVGIFFLFAELKKKYKKMALKNALLKSNVSQLRIRSRFDTLTRLPNENVCKNDLDKMIDKQKSSGHVIAFITLNINNLHSIKVNYNHSACDEALKLLTKSLKKLVNNTAVIYRFQQNEFVILMESSNHRGISRFVETMHHVCSQTYYGNDFGVTLQPDIGIALAPFDGTTMKELRHNSNLAMHANGGNSIAGFNFFDQEMAVQERIKLGLTKSLKSAIENKELILHFQPKVDLLTGQIVGAEALIRWNSPIHGFVQPDVFIPLAEQAGIITDITHWVIENSVIACHEWRELGFNKLCVALNLSAEDFKRGNLSTHTISALNKVNLPAHFLELELTESMLMDDINSIQKQINELRAYGISFAIDDFGTGYSNLGYLTKFNVCTLKLDQSFVKNICHSKSDLQIVTAIIGMSKGLGISNVAEGIEDSATANKLAELGCEMGQGYFWSKPLVQKDFIALLSKEHEEEIASQVTNFLSS